MPFHDAARRAVVLYDADGNAVGVVQDGAFYRLQVEAKLAAGSATIGAVRILDGAGNPLASSVADPVGAEQALIVRNIPSGLQDAVLHNSAGAEVGTVNPSVADEDEEDVLRLQTEARIVGQNGYVCTSKIGSIETALCTHDSIVEGLLGKILQSLQNLEHHAFHVTSCDDYEPEGKD